MKRSLHSWLSSSLRLIQFIFWYVVALFWIFNVLPSLGAYLQSRFDALNSPLKFASVLGFFAVIIIWQALEIRNRRRRK